MPDRLFDVHTKPRGMNEPLQYSEMMKLAIGRGYQYFGYDPNTYVRQEGEDVNSGLDSTDPLIASEPIVNITEEPFIESDEFDSSKYYLKQPPRLPRPLSKGIYYRLALIMHLDIATYQIIALPYHTALLEIDIKLLEFFFPYQSPVAT